MADGDRDELAALIRGWTVHFDWARESGATSLRRRGAPSLPPIGQSANASTVSVAAVRDETAPLQRAASPATPPTAPVSAPAPSAPKSVAAQAAPVAATVGAPEVDRVRATPSPPTAAPPSSSDATALFSDPKPIWGPVTTSEERKKSLALIEDEARACRRCRLCDGRTQSVFARGNHDAELFFVGEAPGADEDRIGKPFVGAAGKLLDRILAAMRMTEDDVYIANVAKCRPPNNRPPEPDESMACGPFLERQIELVRPRVIVSWGRTPTSFLLKKSESMSRLRGRWHEYMGVPVLVTWHPAYLLRNPDAKRDTWADMKLVLEKLGRPVPAGRSDG